jgi:hypothetical protein
MSSQELSDSVGKHKVALVLFLGLPPVTGLLILCLNSRYFSSFFAHPLGWGMVVLFLLCEGISAWALPRALLRLDRNPEKKVGPFLILIGIVLFLLLPAFCIMLVGPTIVLWFKAG